MDLVHLAGSLAEDMVNISRLREHTKVRKVISQIMSISDKVAQRWFDEKGYGWQRTYLEASVRLARFLKEFETTRKLQRKIVESYEEEGKAKSASKIIESHYYEKALRVYSDLGISKKIEELKAKISWCHREAVKKGEFKAVSIPMKIPIPEFVKGYMARLEGKDPETILAIITKDESLIPDLESVKQFVKKMKDEHPFTYLFPIRQMEKYGPLRIYREEHEIFEYKVKEEFNLESEYMEILLHGLFKELLKEKLKPKHLLNYLEKSKNITESSFRLIEKGIAEHFNENYVNSIHILIPQIEETLRNLLFNHGIPPAKYVPKDEVIEQKLLGALVNEAETFIGKNFAEYMRVRLTMDFANIRNKVCHGWMELEEFTEVLSFSLIYIILKLSYI